MRLVVKQFVIVSLCLLVLNSVTFSQPVQAQNGNLLDNAGFEGGNNDWDLCGVAEIVNRSSATTTAAMVYDGERALRLTYAENGCGSPVFDPKAEARQSVTIPANAEAVTVSFWYSRVGDPIWPLGVSLGEYGFLGNIDTVNLTGWHLYRHTLDANDLASVRGKTVPLILEVSFNIGDIALPPAERPGFYVDNVRVVAAIERTTASPRPATLTSDGTKPIVYYDGQLGGIARMNADGSGGQRIDNDAMGELLTPVWSSRGDKIALRKRWLTPEVSNDPQVNQAEIAIIYALNANGSGLREIYRTTGLPGRRPVVPTPGDPEIPALDVIVTAYDWSPDDSQLALTICANNRYFDGSTTDQICWIERINTATGASFGKVEPAFRANWGANNRILYQETDNYGTKPDGIYELNPTTDPLTEELLVPGTGIQFNPSFYVDTWATWSPDNTQFITLRDVDGFHYDEAGNFMTHKAVMLFKRDELLGRQILLIDHGSSPGGFTWSPDGKFILYYLFEGNAVDIWWLEVATGATGKLTNNGSSLVADWRLRCPNPTCSDEVRLHVPMMLR
jgi:hypothetical protein